MGHTHRGMRNAYNILREDTIKETLAQGVKGITTVGKVIQKNQLDATITIY